MDDHAVVELSQRTVAAAAEDRTVRSFPPETSHLPPRHIPLSVPVAIPAQISDAISDRCSVRGSQVASKGASDPDEARQRGRDAAARRQSRGGGPRHVAPHVSLGRRFARPAPPLTRRLCAGIHRCAGSPGAKERLLQRRRESVGSASVAGPPRQRRPGCPARLAARRRRAHRPFASGARRLMMIACHRPACSHAEVEQRRRRQQGRCKGGPRSGCGQHRRHPGRPGGRVAAGTTESRSALTLPRVLTA
mmetsp:Transcript_18325/g.58018  ORF Transcript_18325/g.58018 Transcript_18325/m.58018 type:complete len:249 (+) Transcript_18325:568-1314(+)